MSKFVCANGTITFSNSATIADCLNTATVDISSDPVTYNCMGGDLWVETLPGTVSATFSFETALDDADGIDLGDGGAGNKVIGQTGTFTFDTIDGLAYSGDVIITSASINAPVDDVATVSWEATLDGELTENVS